MKKILEIIVISWILITTVNADKFVGYGEVKFKDIDTEYFIEYLKAPAGQKPLSYWVVVDEGKAIWSSYWYCPEGNCHQVNKNEARKHCLRAAEKFYKRKNLECFIFAKKRVVVWDNGINTGDRKKSSFKSNFNATEIKNKLTELGFIGEVNLSNLSDKKEVKKKETKKTVKKYDLKGERSIALSWEGYDELIAGTVKFDEKDYRGTLNISLPNNDGTCDGTYSLQEGGKGTWQIACSNKMGAAGTLKWIKEGGVTGKGRDHNNKKVKFTVSKKS